MRKWRGRSIVLGSLLLGVVALGVFTINRGPEPNTEVYGTEIEADATVIGAIADAITVTTLDRTVPIPFLMYQADEVLVVTADRSVVLGPDPDSTDDVQVWIMPDRGQALVPLVSAIELPADTPVLLGVRTPGMSIPYDDGTRVVPRPGSVTTTLPVSEGKDRVGAIEVAVTVSERTGEEAGIPGPADIADQRFLRPPAGTARPDQLADGTPIWIVGTSEGASVIDARSPHTVSGLVGWCGSAPGFTDSPGAARFAYTGEYHFGPAPTGLTPYQVRVEGESIVVERRLVPPPRPLELPPGDRPVPGGSITEPGSWCEPKVDNDVGEDYRGDPSWVQHDLSAWPVLDGQSDGWFRTGEIETESGRRRVGELLVKRIRGRTVDVAAPPGVSQVVPPEGPAEPTYGRLIAVVDGPDDLCPASCPHGYVQVQPVVWVTPDGIVELGPDTDRPGGPVTVLPPPTSGQDTYHEPLALRQDAAVGAGVGDLVEVASEDEGGRVETVTPYP